MAMLNDGAFALLVLKDPCCFFWNSDISRIGGARRGLKTDCTVIQPPTDAGITIKAADFAFVVIEMPCR